MHNTEIPGASIYIDRMAELPLVDLVGVGLNATDTLIPLTHYPERGSKTEYQTASVLPGGQVASTVIACQQWGMRTRYVGKLGDDAAAALHTREFDRAGVEARLITVIDGASPQSLIFVDADGERTVLNRRDDRLTLLPEDLDRAWITHARALHVDGHDTGAAALAAEWAHAAGVPVIADLDELYPGLDDLLPNIDYLIASRDFPTRLMGEPNLERALKTMHRRYGCALTAATLGQDGVVAWDGKRHHYAAAYQVPVVDTTGAGDIFHAGFIYALHQGWSLQEQLDFACAAAALNCTAVGARGAIQPVDVIRTFAATARRHKPARRPVRTEAFAAVVNAGD